MEQVHQKKKQQQLQHLQHQFKIYKLNYYARPLITKNVSTYLEFTKFLTQLLPSYYSLYDGSIHSKENATFTQMAMTLFDDILNKLKAIADKLERKEAEGNNNKKDYGQICKLCLHQIRQAEITNAKKSLQGQEIITQNILRILRQIQEETLFTYDEDRKFFQQLKSALQKKSQSIQTCQSEGLQFTNMVEQQLKLLLNNRQQLVFQRESFDNSSTKKGSELKQNVAVSLNHLFSEKMPNIIKLVNESIIKKQNQYKKEHSIAVEVQTMDIDNSKFTDLKKKIIYAESQMNAAIQQQNQLRWTVQAKTISINNIQKQMKNFKEQSNAKLFALQKQNKALEEKNKKLHEEKDKFKSKKQLLQLDSNFKSMNALQISQRQNIRQLDHNEKAIIVEEARRTKKSNKAANKTNGKFFLPTLTKINKQDNQTYTNVDDSDFGRTVDEPLAETNQQGKDQYINGQKTNSRQKDQINQLNSIKPRVSFSKPNTNLKKKMERVNTLTSTQKNTEINHQKVDGFKNLKTDRSKQKFGQILGKPRLTHKESMPLIKTRSNQRNSIGLTDKPIIDTLPQLNELEKIEMQQQAREVNEKLKQKILRSSGHSEKTVNSVFNNKMVSNGEKQGQSQFINRNNKDKDVKNNNEQYRNTNNSVISHSKDKSDDTFMVTRPQQRIQRNVLKQRFEKITEQIDKESYITPQIKSQHKQNNVFPDSFIQKKTFYEHLSQVLNEIVKSGKSEQSQVINEVFIKALQAKISQNYKKNYQQQIKNHRSYNMNLNRQEKENHYYGLDIIKFTNTDFQNQGNRDSFVKKQKNQELNLTKKKLVDRRSNQNKVASLNSKDLFNNISQLVDTPSNQNKVNSKDLFNNNSQLIDRRSNQKRNQSKDKYHVSSLNSKDFFNDISHRSNNILQQTKNRLSPDLVQVKLTNLLFFDEETAFFYETSFNKKMPKFKSVPPPDFTVYLKDLFSKVEQLKYLNNQQYHFVCSLLRYPYSNSQKGSLHLDVIKNMSFNGLVQCFQKIMMFHKKCKQENAICYHMKSFRDRIMVLSDKCQQN